MNRTKQLWKTRNGRLGIIGGVILIVAICCLIILFTPSTPSNEQDQIITETLTSTAAVKDTPEPEPTTISDAAQEYVDQYGGSLNAYIEILSSNDCVFLQEQFDLAAANNNREEPGTAAFQWTLGFMTAADEQMRSVGCY